VLLTRKSTRQFQPALTPPGGDGVKASELGAALTLTPPAEPGNNPGMDDKTTKRGGGAVAVVVLLVVLVTLPLLYVLSAGPVVWMVNNDWIDTYGFQRLKQPTIRWDGS